MLVQEAFQGFYRILLQGSFRGTRKYPISLQEEPTRARYKDPLKLSIIPPFSDPFHSFCKDLTGIQLFTTIYLTIYR